MHALSQIASSLTSIKSRYVKYLEAFCAANGIEVANIKVCAFSDATANAVIIQTEAPLLEVAEAYFGGLPVLVGLK